MGVQHEIDKSAKNIKDTVTEADHRAQARAERERRESAGDLLSPGEKVKSHANEAKHEVLAEVDKAKRAVRDHT
ncbi:MAG TPA: hypothetical protein VME66_08495 [Candidatus Acidoferrales bacterium]|nr:hypothetical protein [Candidatus Acidoferrales bacterium]